MQRKNARQKRRPSLILSAVDRFAAFIYSAIFHGRVGDMMSSGDTLCKRSYLSHFFSRQGNVIAQKTVMDRANDILERSAIARFITFTPGFFASLRIHVYGTFFTFLGLAATITHLISALVNGLNSLNGNELISSVIITVCSVPLLFSASPAIEVIANSAFLHRIMLDILCIPPEKLRVKRHYGGTAYIFGAAILAIVLGAASYVISPMYLVILLACFIIALAILSSPETGIIVTLALVPFMQYISGSTLVLFSLILITAISYVIKVFERKRTVSLSPEITMVLLFCGFILAGGFMSKGGIRTFFDGVLSVTLILGGFFLTFNLINTSKMLSACLKTLTASYVMLCFVGIWDGLYNGISARIIDSVDPSITPLAEQSVLYIADSGAVFGIFAVLLFPMLLAHVSRRKRVQGIFSASVLMMISLIAAFVCSHYEIVIVLLVEFALFWFMNGHKAVTVFIFALIPIGFVFALYPLGVDYLGFPDVSLMLMEYMPASTVRAAYHPSVISDVVEMLIDGNILGIGAGEHAFISVFPAYAGAVSQGATESTSLWLDILCWSGIFGFISFSVFLMFLLKRSLGYFNDPYSKGSRSRALALFCGIVGTMLFGCVYSVWSDYRALFLFWAAVGLLMVHIRIGRNGEEMRRAEFANSSNSKDIELVFYE